jgi:hypothetical protein
MSLAWAHDTALECAGRCCPVCYIRPMKLVETSITLGELRSMAEAGFGDLVKAVVDVQRGIMAVDAELHSDEEALLLEGGSVQVDLWGVNLYPDLPAADWLEFDSMINFYRGLELLDLTIADPRHRRRLKELTRLREVLLDYFVGPNEYGSTDVAWRRYFHAFGMAAAIRKESLGASR